jgi:hypothetical protein
MRVSARFLRFPVPASASYNQISVAELRFLNPYAEIRFTANYLPHWQQSGAVYFVTFRLADAVLYNLRTQWESEREGWLRLHPKPWSARDRVPIA